MDYHVQGVAEVLELFVWPALIGPDCDLGKTTISLGRRTGNAFLSLHLTFYHQSLRSLRSILRCHLNLSAHGFTMPKPSQTKSRARRGLKTRTHNLGGCATCRRRHVKCDRQKPVCGVCTKAGLQCEGFQNGISWASSSHEDVEPNTRRHLYTGILDHVL